METNRQYRTPSARGSFLRCIGVLIFAGFFLAASGQETKTPVVLTLDDVIKLVNSGVSEEVVITRLKRYNRPFDLNSDEILELKQRGVSDPVVRTLIDPATPYTPPAPPAPPTVKDTVTAPGAPLKDPLQRKVPPEPGVYWLTSASPGSETFEPLEFKPLMLLKESSGKLGKLSGGLKKARGTGVLAGEKAKLRVGLSAEVFYVRLDPKAAIDDFVLLRVESSGQRRLLEFGGKPDKPIFPTDSMLRFETTSLAEGLFRIDVKPGGKGEYIFLVLGSGDEKKGILGKGYSFGADPK